MTGIRILLAASVLAGTTSLTTPAQAFFGRICIPTLYNCMCTFQTPCPVTDAKGYAEKVIGNSQLGEKLALVRDLKQHNIDMIMSMTGKVPYGIPGLGSIGIDLNGILNGNLASLGIPNIAGDLVSQLSNLGIDGGLLSSIAGGQLGIDDFKNIAQAAGIDLSALEQIGLGIEQIQALADGGLTISGVFDIAQTLGVEAGVLADIGITQDLIVGIANGQMDPGRILEIAGNAGLDMSQLESVGLGLETLANLPNAGPGMVASVLQQAGFDTSIITRLGIDAGMMADIAAGNLPPQAISQLVQGTGIDPGAIVIPGVNGPIRVGDVIGSNVFRPSGSGMGGANHSTPTAAGTSTADGGRAPNFNDVITIPNASIPGLSNALDSALGKTPAQGTFTGPGANTAAMCATDKALISVGSVPNGFGDDVETINMAISGGDLEIFEEAVDATEGVAASTSAFGYGRAIQIRPVLVKALEAVDTFDDMIKEAKTIQDDVIVNDTIKAQLMTARAETSSMMTALTSTFASATMGRRFLDATPIFPETARWRDIVIKSNRDIEAKQRSGQLSSHNAIVAVAMENQTNMRNQSREALANYNLIQQANEIEAHMPSLEITIDIHETYKENLFSLELIIRNALLILYGADDAEQAWDILYPQLLSSAGSYTDAAKWQNGRQVATTLSSALARQAPVTRYGTRVLVIPATQDDPPIYSMVAQTPYQYPPLDSFAASQNDPYNVIAFSFGSGDDGNGHQSGELALDGVIQYYLATVRREVWNASLRRGDANRMMTGAFWTEMVDHAQQCLSGPIAASPASLLERPEMFDLDKACDHITWSFGDPGDYIDASHLGGADSALWTSKIALDRIAAITGGADQVRADLQASIDTIEGSSDLVLLDMAGNAVAGQTSDAILAELNTALASPDFTAEASYPGGGL